MLLAHELPIATLDIDALPLSGKITSSEIDAAAKQVASDLNINPHWFNDYFNTFTYTLPKNFREHLISVYKGTKLTALALGKDELLIMKCFAGREKDVSHARALVRKGANVEEVEKHLESLQEKKLPGSREAIQFLGDILDFLEE